MDMDVQNSKKDKLALLEDFEKFVNEGGFKPLEKWLNKVNIFDILKVSHLELPHSNMLAWLLDPRGSHGFGERILRGFLQHTMITSELKSSIPESLESFIIRREWKDIDILAISHVEHRIICIENKIWSCEHGNQLERYEETLKNIYPEYYTIYIFLSPRGKPCSRPEIWRSMSYSNILKILDEVVQPDCVNDTTAKDLIQQYKDAIRSNIVGDVELSEKCREIYAKHQQALDFLFEYRLSHVDVLANLIKSWLDDYSLNHLDKILYTGKNDDVKPSRYSYVRFTTKSLSEIIKDQDESESDWHTPNRYFYEIIFYKEDNLLKFYMQLALNSKDLSNANRMQMDLINKIYFPAVEEGENWQWRVPFIVKSPWECNCREDILEGELREALDSSLDDLLKQEKILLERLGKGI